MLEPQQPLSIVITRKTNMNTASDADALDQIISGIYRAAAGLARWEDPLMAISRQLGLWGVQIIGVSKRSNTLLFSYEAGTQLPPEAALDYLRKYHGLNPRLLPALQLQGDAWMHCHHLYDDDFVANDPFYQEFLIPHGGRYISGTKIMDNAETLILFGAMRGNGAVPLDEDDMRWLVRVRHHLVEAMKLYLHLRDVYAMIGSGAQLLNQFRYPMVLIDDQRAIRFKNQVAESALPAADFVFTSGDTLRFAGLKNDTDFLLALRALELHTPATAASRKNRAFVRLQSGPGQRSVVAFLIAVRPEVVMGTFGHAPLALVVFHDTEQHRDLDPFIIGELFDLTPAEAKIATRIVQGMSLEKIAEEFKIALSTVRTQLYSVFAKTGVNRQAELVSLLSALPNI